ncbi:MAG: TetR/AcrR family transcriptional regulator [Acidimicrobiales bacterium]
MDRTSKGKACLRPVCPRPYNLGKRQALVDESRRQVLDAARALLGGAARYTAFTVDAVAARADVARATVYYQFGSKTGLLEALCDDLAGDGQMADLAGAFANPEPVGALADFVACFGRFWQADRRVMRRLRALAALDPEVGQVVADRDDRRRQGLGVLVDRLAARYPTPPLGDRDRSVRVLLALTGFEIFDALAGTRALDAVSGEIAGLAGAALGLPAP